MFYFFSPDETPLLIWPTLSLLKTIEFPFIERFEVIFYRFICLLCQRQVSRTFLQLFSALVNSLEKGSYDRITRCRLYIYFHVFLYNPSFFMFKR